MLVVISPSKTQNFDKTPMQKATIPSQITQSLALMNILKSFSTQKIATLMSISDQLAKLNYQRFQAFHTPFDLANAKQALLAFRGDVYSGIDTEHYSQSDFEFAQQYLRILSGLYGILKPLDLIQAYRLEMGIKLKNQRGNNLYQFWGERLSAHLNEEETDTIINLASKEYFKAIIPKALKANILTVDFKELKSSTYKTIGIYAKRARGLMANFIIKNRITDYHKLRRFNALNYSFNQALSKPSLFVFTRELHS